MSTEGLVWKLTKLRVIRLFEPLLFFRKQVCVYYMKPKNFMYGMEFREEKPNFIAEGRLQTLLHALPFGEKIANAEIPFTASEAYKNSHGCKSLLFSVSL